MALPERAVRRPVTVLMATLAVAIFGFIAARRLPMELLPDLAYPTLTIQTAYPDAPPVSVERFVTRPIEEAVGVIPGVRDMRSTTRAGLSEVVLEFEWDEEMDFIALDVREKLGLVELPAEADVPRVLRYDPSLDPIVRIAFAGDAPLHELRQIAERWLKPRLEAVRGVAAAKVRGGLFPEIQVETDEDRLAALGLTMDELASALRLSNVNYPGGALKDWGSVYLVRTLQEFSSLEQLRRTVVREAPQGRVRVEDVAEVRRGHRDRDVITRSNGREAVEIALHREGSANTLGVAGTIADELVKLRRELGPGLELRVLTDQSGYIRDAISEVWSAALIGGILAVLVLYFFLRGLPATAIIALTIPVSVVATFLPMHQAGVSLNIMSLGGLALGVGMLVDNSIVVLEAIDRRRQGGLSRREAAIRGAGEVAGAVTASTLTTVSVFLPIVFTRGVAGQLFYDLAGTVCLSLLASLLVSLTLIPSLAALDPARLQTFSGRTLFRWDQPAERGGDPPWTFRLGGVALLPVGDGVHWMSRMLTVVLFPPRFVLLATVALTGALWWLVSGGFNVLAWPLSRLFDNVGRSYPSLLRGALRLRWPVLTLTFALFAMSLLAMSDLGTNLVPDLAQGQFAFRVRLPEGTPLESTARVVEQIEAPLLDDPRFARIFSVIGSLPSSASGQQTLGENLAQIDFVLPDQAGAEAEAAALRRVRQVLAMFGNVEAELVHPSVLTLEPDVEVDVFHDDLELLDAAVAELAAVLQDIPGIEDVATTSEPGSPEVRISPDRERAGALGVQAEQIGRTLRRQIRGELVGKFREEEERLDIRLRAGAAARSRASDVESLRVMVEGGTLVPISALASVEVGRGPAAIHRSGGARMARATAKVVGADLGPTLERVREAVRQTSLPGDAVAEMAGQDEELQVSFASLKLALALAIFLVFVVMAMQFESLLHPFVIMLSVPLGAIGVIGVLLLTRTSLSVLVLIGIVMLAGIVVNNAIVLVDAINRRRRLEGQPLIPAILEAGRERLRPILMTTGTTVLALLPMALGLGAGDELRRPMAITVIGGLTTATLLTLVVIPCMYRVFSRGSAVPSDGETEGAPSPEPASGVAAEARS
ncbi:MAG: efflux RND transporter permease subunit [Planctomycetota bacterium]